MQTEATRLMTNPVKQILTERWLFTETDTKGNTLRQEEEILTLRWTYRQEMRYLFQLAGFTVEHEFSDYRESPPAYAAEQIYITRLA